MKVLSAVCSLTCLPPRKLYKYEKRKYREKHYICIDAINRLLNFRKLDYSFFPTILNKMNDSVYNAVDFFPFFQMAVVRIEGKLAAIYRDNHGEHPRKNQARDTNIPRNQEDYITQFSEEN